MPEDPKATEEEGKVEVNDVPQTVEGEQQSLGEKNVGDPKEIPIVSPPISQTETQTAPMPEDPEANNEGKEVDVAVKDNSQTVEGQKQSLEEKPPLAEAAEKKVEEPKEIPTVSPPDSQTPTVQVIEEKDDDDGNKEAVPEDKTLNVLQASKKKPGEPNELTSQSPPDQTVVAESTMEGQ